MNRRNVTINLWPDGDLGFAIGIAMIILACTGFRGCCDNKCCETQVASKEGVK